MVCLHSVEIQQINPKVGWVEQDPLDIVNNILLCVQEACKKLPEFGYSVKDIVSIGVTNQRETTVVWDKITGQPLYNAIGEYLYGQFRIGKLIFFVYLVWSDNRTEGIVDKILARIPDQNKDYFKSISGNDSWKMYMRFVLDTPKIINTPK